MIKLHPQPEALEDPYPATLQALNDVMKFARSHNGAMSTDEFEILREIGKGISSLVEELDPHSKHLVEAC